jgi:hypothetical protein
VQVAQLVEIADVHLLAADLLVEIQQVDGAAHPVLAVLVRDDGSVLEEPLHQPGDCADKFQALVAHRRVFLAQFRHQRLEEILVVLVSPSALHQDVQLGDQFIFNFLKVALQRGCNSIRNENVSAKKDFVVHKLKGTNRIQVKIMNNQKGDFNYELLKYKVGVDPIAQN